QFSDYFTYLQSDTIVRPSSLTRRSSVLTAATISSGVAEVRDTGTDAGGVLAQPAARTAASTVKAWIGFMRTTRWAGESAAALPAARVQAVPAAAAQAPADHDGQDRTIRASRVARTARPRAPDRRTDRSAGTMRKARTAVRSRPRRRSGAPPGIRRRWRWTAVPTASPAPRRPPATPRW